MLSLTYCALSTLVCADDLQPSMHMVVGHYPLGGLQSEKWETDKKALAGYSQEQLTRALIAELDLDRNSPQNNKKRDLAAYSIFRALDLPPTMLCQELDKPQSPERKTSLIFVLRGIDKPEVVRALLRQLGDRRTVIMPESFQGKYFTSGPLRVCDKAFMALVYDANVPGLKKIEWYLNDETKDKIIQEGVAKLNMTLP